MRPWPRLCRPASFTARPRQKLPLRLQFGDTSRSSSSIGTTKCEPAQSQRSRDCLRDEPQWRGLLEVTEVELDHEHTSLN